MKNLFIVLLALLILASCKDKEKPPIPVAKITMEANPATVVTGAKLKLTPTVEPGDAANKTLTWESSAPTIATVDSNGEVTGVAAGTATITATAADGSKVTGTIALTVKSNDASVSAIILGGEKFTVPMPADGATTITLNNAPRTLSSTIKEVAVNITAAAGATIRIGTEDFKQGQVFDFTGSKEFKVTAEDGTTVKTYTLAIAAYHPASNPYGVYTAAHLNDVRNDKAGNYKLMNNLALPALNDAGAAATTGIEDYPEKGWLPIAHDATVVEASFVTLSSSGGFTGTFDGGHFSINNLYINRSINFAGLFGVTSEATLKDLNITGTTSPSAATSEYAGALAGLISQSTVINCRAVNFSISFTPNSSSPSSAAAGGLVGRNHIGVISNCYTMGSISVSSSHSTATATAAGGLVGRSYNGRINNCHAAGSISASPSSYYVGGLVGRSINDKIINCYAAGSVSASSSYPGSSYAGGLAGYNAYSSISNCYATGSVSSSHQAGGLVGTNQQGKITNCYATGSVSSSISYAGGLVGDDRGEITNCYATGSVSTSSYGSYAGGLAGGSYGNSTISNCYATGSVSASGATSHAGGLLGFSGHSSTITNCYATGSVSTSSSGSYAGGLLGKTEGISTFSNCYRNSEAEIKKNNASSEPDDASFTGITAKSKKDMQTDAFTTSLNKDVSVWGRSSGKNDDLPYIKGVGVGKN